MPKIVWLDQQQIREQAVPNRGFLSVGSAPDNSIVLPHLNVSPHHATLICGPHGCLLKDLKSKGGVEVNGLPVHSRFLRSGDVIRIGPHVLEYHGTEGPTVLETKEQPPSYRFVTGAPHSDLPPAAVTKQKRAFLRYTDGPDKGRVQTIDRPLLPVGDPGGYYAAVSQRTNGYYLLNLGKETYVKLNDTPVHGAGAALANGDVILLGDNRIEFRLFSQDER